jgi:hypothetical protein
VLFFGELGAARNIFASRHTTPPDAFYRSGAFICANPESVIQRNLFLDLL